MREILTQEEVDALLEAYDSGEIEAKPPADAPCAPFDFLSRKHIGGVQETLMELILDGTAKGGTGFLSGIIRREVKVTAASTYTETAGNFQSNFRGPSCIGLLTAEGRAGHGYLAMSPYLAYALIDLMLGGEGRIAEPEGREFSVLEVRMIRKIMDGIAVELSKAWSSAAQEKFFLSRVETNPKMLPPVQEQDPLYVANFRVESETGLSRDFSVALPFDIVESLRGKQADTDVDPKASEYHASLRVALDEIVVDVVVLLGEANIPVHRILSLKPGDVITTEQEIDAPVAVRVEGIPKLYGRAGISRGKRAVKVIGG